MAGIYIHIPFCRQACSYCDFFFVTSLEYRERFVERLTEEVYSYRNTPYADAFYETVYLGGGTPSVLSASQLLRILKAVWDVFNVQPEEVTMEMNPDNVSADYLRALREAGIQRASMGVQSFQAELLEFMHRAHNRKEAIECLELLASADFESWSVDLIYGNPGQSLDQLDHDLQQLTRFDPPHVSAYSLTIEPRTRLGKQHELGRLQPLPDEKVAEHFDRVGKRLKEAGLDRYEVSNYARPGQEAVHNSGYWRHTSYLGIGPAAHSFWWPSAEQPARRWENKPDFREYLASDERPPLAENEQLTDRQLAEERIMMGLRTRKGVTQNELSATYHYPLTERQQAYLERKKEEGLLKSTDPICLGDEGLKIADSIILDLVSMKDAKAEKADISGM